MQNLKNILVFLLGSIFLTNIAYAAPTVVFQKSLLPEVTDRFDLGSSTPALEWNGLYVKTICLSGTCKSAWPTGGGGSGGGSWSTTTSQVANQLINYPNNTTDVVVIGASATTSANYYIDPNVNYAFFKNASTTALSATTFCLSSDCKTAWPAGGYPFGVAYNSTTTLVGFNGGLTAFASSTIGSGIPTGGLTINGGATTTGNAYFYSPVGINGITNRGGFGGSGVLTINGDASNSAVFEFFRPISSGASNVFTFTFGDTSNSVLGQINGRTDSSGSTGLLQFLTSNGSANTERMRVNSQGQVMVGTTTAFTTFAVASSTGPQLALLDGSNTNNAWTMRAISNSLFFATSTNSSSATSTASAFAINAAGTPSFFGGPLPVVSGGTASTTLGGILTGNGLNGVTATGTVAWNYGGTGLSTGGTAGQVLGWTNGALGYVSTTSGGASLSGGTAGMMAAWTSATALTATSAPVFASFIATSSQATSTHAGAFYIGTTTSGVSLNTPFVSIDTGARTSEEAVMVAGSVNDFFEMNIKNGSAGPLAQSCWTATNNTGNLTNGFFAMCANSSGFWNPQAYNVGGGSDTSIMSLTAGDLFISQGTAGKAIRFTVGGNSTTTLSGNETFNFAAATSTTYRDFKIATTSGSAFVVTDKYGGSVLNLSTASTTGIYDLLELWTATSTGPIFGVDQAGHVFASSTTPIISTCGTAPSLTSDSSDFSGTITVGSVAATACTLTFGTPHTVGTHCVISERTGSVTNVPTITQSLTGFTYTQTGLTSDLLDYICTGK